MFFEMSGGGNQKKIQNRRPRTRKKKEKWGCRAARIFYQKKKSQPGTTLAKERGLSDG